MHRKLESWVFTNIIIKCHEIGGGGYPPAHIYLLWLETSHLVITIDLGLAGLEGSGRNMKLMILYVACRFSLRSGGICI